MSPSIRRLVVAACLAATACGSEPQQDAPATETPAPPEGVFGTAPAAVAGTPSIVTLRPATGGTAPARSENPRMDQLGLAFTPGLLMVRVGETVTFSNSESVTHNVHVVFSDDGSVVLHHDTDPEGSVDLPMEREGGYEVTCELHPGMRAFIYVTSAPYADFASASGSYRIEGVPIGSYDLAVWSVDPEVRSERAIEVTGPSTQVP